MRSSLDVLHKSEDLSESDPLTSNREKDYAISSKFNHPYQPYEIQMDFMSDLYDTLEESKIGIFESPTGMCFNPDMK